MIGLYAAPRIQSWPQRQAVVDSQWPIVVGVAAIVATILGIAVAIVLSVCYYCGTLGQISTCLQTMQSWLQNYYC